MARRLPTPELRFTLAFLAPALLALALLAVAPLPAAQAGEPSWTIDPEHSAVKFSIKHLMFASVDGEFHKVHGTVHFDGKSLEKSDVEAAVDTGSVDTHMKARDQHLVGKDILSAVQFPAISFKSTSVVPAKNGSFKILGRLSLHGMEKDVVLNASPLQAIEKKGDGLLHTSTSATTELSRKDFGITVDKAIDHGGAVVGEKVKITLNISLTTPFDAKIIAQTDPSEPASK